MGRTGNTDFTGNIPDFITLCEARLNYGSDDSQFPSPPLRVQQMEVPSTTITFLQSSYTQLLPPDYLEMRRIYMVGNPNQKMTYVTPNQMDATILNSPNSPGPPKFYTIQGNQLVLPAPVNTTQTIVMGYYQKIPALSASNTSNWLMQTSPGIYLAGVQLEGAIFVRDPNDASLMARLFSSHTNAFRKQDLKGRYSGDALQIKTDTGNP